MVEYEVQHATAQGAGEESALSIGLDVVAPPAGGVSVEHSHLAVAKGMVEVVQIGDTVDVTHPPQSNDDPVAASTVRLERLFERRRLMPRRGESVTV